MNRVIAFNYFNEALNVLAHRLYQCALLFLKLCFMRHYNRADILRPREREYIYPNVQTTNDKRKQVFLESSQNIVWLCFCLCLSRVAFTNKKNTNRCLRRWQPMVLFGARGNDTIARERWCHKNPPYLTLNPIGNESLVKRLLQRSALPRQTGYNFNKTLNKFFSIYWQV